MSLCDMCGFKEGNIEAIVEGIMLNVCENCSKFGEVIRINPKVKLPEKIEKKIEQNIPVITESITMDFARKIKMARERLNLKQEELAHIMGVKTSLIHSFETGGIEPSLDTAKKIEKYLKIRLIEEIEEEKTSTRIDFRNQETTIGDLIKLKKRK